MALNFMARSRTLLPLALVIFVVFLLLWGAGENAPSDFETVSSLIEHGRAVSSKDSEQIALAPPSCEGSSSDPRACGHWVDTWNTAPQLPVVIPGRDFLPPPFAGPPVFKNATLRQTVQITAGASRFRLRLSNAVSTSTLPIEKVTIALPVGDNPNGSPIIDPSTLQQVTFSKKPGIRISPGGIGTSDAISFSLNAAQTVTISIYVRHGQETKDVTYHHDSYTTTWLAVGDRTDTENIKNDPTAKDMNRWYLISALEAWQPPTAGAIALFGDSITDGGYSRTDTNTRWGNRLYERLQDSPDPYLRSLSVLNQGIAGNELLNDVTGPATVSRVNRDVLSHAGVKYVVLLVGTNDLGHSTPTHEGQDAFFEAMTAAFQQIAAQVHAHGIPLFVATILPFLGGCDPNEKITNPFEDPLRDETRQKLNNWIRDGPFDGVIDFDVVLKAPGKSSNLRWEYSSDDCMHPNPVGHRAMAEAVPLDLFTKFADGVSGYE